MMGGAYLPCALICPFITALDKMISKALSNLELLENLWCDFPVSTFQIQVNK